MTTDYEKLLIQKVSAGLPLADAKEVIERQKARDAREAAASAAAAPATDTSPAAPTKKGAKAKADDSQA